MRISLWILVCFGAASVGWGQSWSVGALAGFGFSRDVSITNAGGSAQAGFASDFAAGAVLSQDVSDYFGGELRYVYRAGNSQLQSGGEKVTLHAASHIVVYDLLYYLWPKSVRIRPYVAAGPAVRIYTATGHELVNQPLSDFALLLHRNQTKPIISFGGGVKAALGEHFLLRADFRDYLSPFPGAVIAPAASAREHGWLHDFVPAIGVDWRFGH